MLYRNTPPDPADDPLGAVVDRLMQHPAAQDLLNNVSGKVDWFAQFLDRAAKGAFDGAGMPRAYGVREPRHRPQTPPPREPQKPAFDARAVMGFKPRDALTADIIKQRYRRLAKENHPDRTGGDDSRMKAINRARDALMEEFR
jgi:DnaJ-domain-containing protein 1